MQLAQLKDLVSRPFIYFYSFFLFFSFFSLSASSSMEQMRAPSTPNVTSREEKLPKTFLPFVQEERASFATSTLTAEDESYYTIASVEIEEVDYNGLKKKKNGEKALDDERPYIYKRPEYKSSVLGDIVLMADRLIGIGKKIWKLVSDSKAVVSTGFTAFSVLPKVEKLGTLSEMEGWSMPKLRHYNVTYNNLLGIEVIKFNFSIIFQHDGTFKGAGKYITGGNVIPNTIDVAWGHDFNATSKLLSISNHGTLENPLAGATLALHYKMSNAINNVSTDLAFHITGDGKIVKLE